MVTEKDATISMVSCVLGRFNFKCNYEIGGLDVFDECDVAWTANLRLVFTVSSNNTQALTGTVFLKFP